MRTLIILLTLTIIFMASPVFSQIKKGTFELSVSGTVGSYKFTEESTEKITDPYSGNQTYTDKRSYDPEKYLMMFIRPGYYIFANLAIEPEMAWTTMDGTEPSLSFSGNISYNFASPNSSLTPFLFAGYGIGNSIPFNYTLIFRMTDNMDVKLINLGAGLKAHLTDRVAFRVEYRYQMYSAETEYSYSYNSYSYERTSKSDYDFHNLFFGFSVFFRK